MAVTGGEGMAFRRCDSCDGVIAARAVICPHCDSPLPETELTMQRPDRMSGSGAWGSFFLVVVVVVLLADLSGVVR